MIIDGSPGIGCPVIASVAGASMALVVTEPTLSGAHDLKRVCELTSHFDVPTFVCVNKRDLNSGMADPIEAEANRAGTPVLGQVRYDGCPLRLKDVESKCRDVLLRPGPQELPAGFGLTGEVPRVHGWEAMSGGFFMDSNGAKVSDPLLDDQSLYWDGPGGLVVVAGCAHAGIVNTLERVLEITGKDRVRAVVGGLHLVSASEERIGRTIDAFRRLGVERVGVGHCTGLRAMRRFFDAFEAKCFLCSVGTNVSFGV